MKPLIKPWKPNYYQLIEKRKKMKWDRVSHESWHYYLQ